jgi:hypothetical protein
MKLKLILKLESKIILKIKNKIRIEIDFENNYILFYKHTKIHTIILSITNKQRIILSIGHYKHTIISSYLIIYYEHTKNHTIYWPL